MKRRVVMEDLGNMNPGELEPRSWDGGETDFTSTDTIDTLPEKECMKARIATFQAIMEEVVKDAADNADPNASPAQVADEVYKTADEVTDKAVALHLVPSSMHRIIHKLVAYTLKPRNNRAALYARAAHLCAEALTTDSDDPAYNAGTPAIDTPLGESPDDGITAIATNDQDESPADGTSPTTAWWNMEGDDVTSSSGTEGDDPAYNAGTPEIDTPLGVSPDDGLTSVATNDQDESPADGTSPTTAWWKMEDEGIDAAGPDEKTDDDTPAEDDSAKSSSDEETPAEDTSDADESAAADSDSAEDTPTESSDAVTPSDVVVDEGVDKDTAAEMRYVITTACHHRRATAKLSRRFSGKLVNRMLNELRYTLPDSFLSKFGI